MQPAWLDAVPGGLDTCFQALSGMEPGLLPLLLQAGIPGKTSHEEQVEAGAAPVHHLDAPPKKQPLASVAGSVIVPLHTGHPLQRPSKGPARLGVEAGHGAPERTVPPAVLAEAIPLLHAMLERLGRGEPPQLKGESEFRENLRPIISAAARAQGVPPSFGQGMAPSSSVPVQAVVLPLPATPTNFSTHIQRAKVSMRMFPHTDFAASFLLYRPGQCTDCPRPSPAPDTTYDFICRKAMGRRPRSPRHQS